MFNYAILEQFHIVSSNQPTSGVLLVVWAALPAVPLARSRLVLGPVDLSRSSVYSDVTAVLWCTRLERYVPFVGTWTWGCWLPKDIYSNHDWMDQWSEAFFVAVGSSIFGLLELTATSYHASVIIMKKPLYIILNTWRRFLLLLTIWLQSTAGSIHPYFQVHSHLEQCSRPLLVDDDRHNTS